MFTSDPALPDAAATHSHALWRTLLEATGDGVLVLGARGTVLAMNPAFGGPDRAAGEQHVVHEHQGAPLGIEVQM